MIEKLQYIIEQYEDLIDKSISPDIVSDSKKSIQINKKLSALQNKYNLAQEYMKYHNELVEAKEMIETESNGEMIQMAKEQKKSAEGRIAELNEKLKIALLPTDPNDDKNIYLEIRPAAGGNESGLFGTELLRMYLAYAQAKGWDAEIMEEQLSDIGGVKLVVIKISGNNVYSLMKFESGVHRVQRIPETESQGRVHTSTVTVVIMPEAEDVDVKLDPKDIKLDTYAGSSAGGQNANKNQTGVRLHHKPSGLIVDIGDSKSQIKNKEKAFSVLKSRLYQIELDKAQASEKEKRGTQIGTGDRSEKIRTYNFPQDRITDHRIKVSWSNIPDILSGNLDEIMDRMVLENQSRLLGSIEKK